MGERIVVGVPLMEMVPESISSAPDRILIRVDLPAPFCPQEDVDLARAQLEVDAVKRVNRVEPLFDVLHSEEGGTVIAGHGCSSDAARPAARLLVPGEWKNPTYRCLC